MSLLVTTKWVWLVLCVRVPLMEVELHVLFWQSSEQRLLELDILGLLPFNEIVQVGKVEWVRDSVAARSATFEQVFQKPSWCVVQNDE